MSSFSSGKQMLFNGGFALLSALAMLAASDGTAHAQVTFGVYQPVGSHASTLAEGYLRGRADLSRSAGLYNFYTSQALINREAARSRYIENRAKERRAHFELRRMARADRAARIASRRRSRASRESHARNSKVSLTKRLSIEQLNPVSGKIAWPLSLNAPRFAQFRNRLESLFANRSVDNSGLDSQNYRDIRMVTKQMKHRLRLHIREYDPVSYIAAKKFIDSLAYEARFAALVEGHAVELSYRPQVNARQSSAQSRL